MANNQMELQQMMNAVVQHSESLSSVLNTLKTTMMVLSKKPVKSGLWISGESIEQMPSVRYIGNIIRENYDRKIGNP